MFQFMIAIVSNQGQQNGVMRISRSNLTITSSTFVRNVRSAEALLITSDSGLDVSESKFIGNFGGAFFFSSTTTMPDVQSSALL